MDSLLIAVTSLYLMKITIQVSSHGNYPAQDLADVLVQDQTGIFKKSAPSKDDSSMVTMAIPYRLGIPVNVKIVASRFRREEQPGNTSREKILQDAFRECPKLLEGSDSSPDIPFLSLSHAVMLEVVDRSCNTDLVWRLAGRLEPGHRWSAEQRLMIKGNVGRLVRSQKELLWGKKKTTEQWKEQLRVVINGSQNDSPSLSLLSGYPWYVRFAGIIASAWVLSYFVCMLLNGLWPKEPDSYFSTFFSLTSRPKARGTFSEFLLCVCNH